MKKLIIFNLFAVFLLYSCGESDPSDRQSFHWDLRGVWVSNDPSVYDGELIIDYNWIEIWGYAEDQTPQQGGDDTQRPFRDFTTGVRLTGYSEAIERNEHFHEGLIFIRDAGELKEIPFRYWTEDYGSVKFLRFTFGGRNETLRHIIPD